MRSDHDRIRDIVEAAEHIATFISGLSYEEFALNHLVRAGVQYEIMVAGEAARQMSQEFKAQHVGIPWAGMIQLRNFYIHVYHKLDMRLLWRAVTVTVPEFSRKLSALLSTNNEQE